MRILHGERTFTQTAEPLAADRPANRVVVKAIATNANFVYVGGPTVANALGGNDNILSGFQLDAGEETPMLVIDNLNEVYVVGDVGTQSVVYIALA